MGAVSPDMGAVSPEKTAEALEPRFEGIIRVVLPSGEHISGEYASSRAEEIHLLADGVPRPVLLVITGVASISREARAIYSEARSSSAIAVLGATSVDRVIANFLLGGDPPRCPSQFFTSEAAALAWLKGVPDDR